MQLGYEIKAAVNAKMPFVHPEIPEFNNVYGVMVYGDPRHEGSTQANCCVYADRAVDRSPTGSGTAGRVAQLYLRGEMAASDTLVNESIIGTIFKGRVLSETKVGEFRCGYPGSGRQRAHLRLRQLGDRRSRSAQVWFSGELSHDPALRCSFHGKSASLRFACRGAGESGGRICRRQDRQSGTVGHPSGGWRRHAFHARQRSRTLRSTNWSMCARRISPAIFATINGEVVAYDAVTGVSLFALDGPTVTGRRTAAVTLSGHQPASENTAEDHRDHRHRQAGVDACAGTLILLSRRRPGRCRNFPSRRGAVLRQACRLRRQALCGP